MGIAASVAKRGLISRRSSAFEQGNAIPVKYADKGAKYFPRNYILRPSPPTRALLVLIIDDLDAPTGIWTHWLVWNLPPDTTTIPEGKLPSGAIQGKNSFGRVQYDGPAPPSGTHHYFFHVFALDAAISLSAGSDRAALEAAMKGQLPRSGVTFGVYSESL